MRRVHLHAQDDQTELFTYWRHFAFITNRTEPIAPRRRRAPPTRPGRARHPRSQRPGARALPVRSLQRQQRLDGDRVPRAQPAAAGPPARPQRPNTADRRDDAPAAVRAARPAHPQRPAPDAAPARPLALADRLHRSAHPHPSAPRRLTRTANRRHPNARAHRRRSRLPKDRPAEPPRRPGEPPPRLPSARDTPTKASTGPNQADSTAHPHPTSQTVDRGLVAASSGSERPRPDAVSLAERTVASVH